MVIAFRETANRECERISMITSRGREEALILNWMAPLPLTLVE